MARINASLPIQGEIRFETYSKRQAIVPVASAEPFSFSPRHTKQSTPRKQARTEGGGGGCTGCTCTSPPAKKFRSEMSKRGEKVPPRYVGKKECARSSQVPQN